jgi:hypothetical protein
MILERWEIHKTTRLDEKQSLFPAMRGFTVSPTFEEKSEKLAVLPASFCEIRLIARTLLSLARWVVAEIKTPRSEGRSQ